MNSLVFATAWIGVLMQPGGSGPDLPRSVMAGVSGARAHATVTRLAGFGTRHTLSDTTSETRGIGAARRWLKAEMESHNAGGGVLRVGFEEFPAPVSQRIPQGGAVVNVVGVLPGTMPEAAGRAYYVVGHYDSRNGDGMDIAGDAPGANDDASGTAVVMELARVLAHRPLESTVVFLCTAGEEQGLIGAKFHADSAAARTDLRVMGVLNSDIVGDPWSPRGGGGGDGATPGLIRVFSEGIPRNPTAEQASRIRSLASEHDSGSRQLARFVAYVAEREQTVVRPKLVFRIDRFLRGGDHSPFLEQGIPAVRFTEVDEDYSRQHQNVTTRDARPYGDVPEFVDAEYLGNVARLNAAVLVHLANAPSPPGRARVVTAQLMNDTLLRWEPSPEPDTAGYEVVWRATTEPQWVQVRDAGAATEIMLPVSKDDNFFGVRAYDRDGYRSPVAFATAGQE